MTSILQKSVENLRKGRDLEERDAEALLDALISETDESLMAEVFIAWDNKGIEEDEIYSIARILRGRCTKVNSRHETVVDIVGTGGSKAKTFNVSTAAAFVAAGAGVAVAKHGNKAATSNTGSADVLSALGIEPAVDAATAETCLNDIGICFMFAPNFHRLSPTLGKVRRGLGFPTIFNCVGPLCNPAGVPHQVIGVWDKQLIPKMAGALARLGTKRSWIVHGGQGLDELSLCGSSVVAEVENGSFREFEVSPADFGIAESTMDGLRCDSPLASCAVIRGIFQDEPSVSSAHSIVSMNAAAALFVSGNADNLSTAARMATQSILEGRALAKLNALGEATRR
jgi:anthranilate phosphoribosyltransferase